MQRRSGRYQHVRGETGGQYHGPPSQPRFQCYHYQNWHQILPNSLSRSPLAGRIVRDGGREGRGMLPKLALEVLRRIYPDEDDPLSTFFACQYGQPQRSQICT